VSGWSAQALFLAALVFVTARFHDRLIPPRDYRVTRLVVHEALVLPEPQPVIPPVLARSKPPLENKPLLESKPSPPSPEGVPAVAALVVTPGVRTIREHKLPEPDRPAPELKLDSKMPVIPTVPTSKIVALNTFSGDSPVTAPASKPATAVQIDGFGDGTGNGAGNGSGYGHGMGGSNPNAVMSSGFGNGAIEAFNSPSAHPKTPSQPSSHGADAPVEITFKPKPDYTDEGRKQKINGEVRLQVLFRSDGRVQVIRVLQGLGYGLDEQAVKAAEQIKFTPALREGRPVDSTALVHIIFELIS
jgi:TonB family protein